MTEAHHRKKRTLDVLVLEHAVTEALKPVHFSGMEAVILYMMISDCEHDLLSIRLSQQG